MSDPFELLHGLTPPVDDDHAAAAFGDERIRRRRRRSFATAAATVVLVALVAIPAAIGLSGLRDQSTDVAAVDGDGSPADPDPGAGSGAVSFEVLDVLTETGEEMGTMRAALDEPTYERQWSSFGDQPARPDVDFERAFVLAITIPDDACPPDLVRFDGFEDALVPVFVEPDVDCNEPLIPKTFIVAIATDRLPDQILFRLPADDLYDLPAHELLIDRAVGTVEGERTATAEPDPEPAALPGEAVDTYPYEGASLIAVGLADGAYVSVHARPDRETGVVAELLWNDTGIEATGHNREVDGQRWTEVRFQGATGWAPAESLLQQLDRTEELIDQLYPNPDDRPVATDLGALALKVVDTIGREPYTAVATFDFPDDTTGPGTLRVDVINIGDDTVGGYRLLLRADEHADGLVLTSVERQDLCRRGVSPDGCV